MQTSYQDLLDGGMPSGVPGNQNAGMTPYQPSTEFNNSHLDPNLMQFGDEYGYGGTYEATGHLNNLAHDETAFEEDSHLLGYGGQSEIPSQFEELMDQQNGGG